MATCYIYCDPDDKHIVNITKTQMSAEARGARVEIAKDDSHAIFSDEDPKVNWQLNSTDDDIELVT